MTMWVRASGVNAAAHLVDLWNSTHPDKIELTTIPDNQMVTKLATGVQAGEVPDLVSFDLIYMPDFMKAGFLVDLTADLKADPNYASVAKAYKDIATYEGKLYGAGFTPDVSILVWNKDLFKKAGLDPDKPPQTIGEIHEDAKKIRALGSDTYGFYFSGACPGCNIFTTSPMMVAAGSKMLPANGNDDALTGDGVKDVLETFKEMWSEGLVPEERAGRQRREFHRRVQDRQDRHSGHRRLPALRAQEGRAEPQFRRHLPARRKGRPGVLVCRRRRRRDPGRAPSMLRSPRQFIAWELTDEAQLEGLAKNNICRRAPRSPTTNISPPIRASS